MALRATQLHIQSYADLQAMPDDGNRYELIGGEIVMSPAPKLKHQFAVFELAKLMSAAADAAECGIVMVSPIDVRFDAYNVFQPDIVFVSRSRAAILHVDRIEGTPDLIVEVLSAATRGHDLLRKAAIYESFGVAEYWIVDPEPETVVVNTLVDGHYVTANDDPSTARSNVIPGLALNVDEIFPIRHWMEGDKETE